MAVYRRSLRPCLAPPTRPGDDASLRWRFTFLRMRTRARAVVIGGGVGGCAILYWLTRLGWDDVVLVERADLTSGSTFHSAGLVGQLRSSLSLTRMMMSERRSLPDDRRRGRSRDGLARGGVAAAGVLPRAARGDRPPGGLGEDVRPPARADLRRGGAGALPADDDRRRPRRRVSADRRLHRPVTAHVRARRGRAARRRRDRDQHARHRDPGGAGAGRRASSPTRARSRPTSSSTRAGCSPPSSADSRV